MKSVFSIDLVALLVRDARARLRGDGYAQLGPRRTSGRRLGAELDPLQRALPRTCGCAQPAGRPRRQPALAAEPPSTPTRRVRPDPRWGGLSAAPADR